MPMDHDTEMQRIYEAERRAKEYISNLPPEVVQECGEANLLSDLTHEYLLHGIPSSTKNKIESNTSAPASNRPTQPSGTANSDSVEIDGVNSEWHAQTKGKSRQSESGMLRVFSAVQRFGLRLFKVSAYFFTFIIIFTLLPLSIGTFFSQIYENLGTVAASIFLYVLVFFLPTTIRLIFGPDVGTQDFLEKIDVRNKIQLGATSVAVTAFFHWLSRSHKSFFSDQVTVGAFICIVICMAISSERRHQ
jgi:hypothetical protein